MLNKYQLINLFHILFVGPLLIYVGRSFGLLSNYFKYFLIVLGVFVILYQGKNLAYFGILAGWIYAIHVFIVGPLLVYVGLYGEKAFVGAFPVLTMLGFATMGYHGMQLLGY